MVSINDFNLGKNLDYRYMIVFYNKEDDDYIIRYTVDNIYEEIKNLLNTENGYFIHSIYDYNEDKSINNSRYINNNAFYNLALSFASEKHNEKTRKGINPVPYINHPINVSKYIEKYMENSEYIDTYRICALLHDTIEDTDASYDEIKVIFGEKIADIVYSLTNDEDEIKNLGKDVYLTNKMLNMNNNTLTLKLCDRLDNVTGLKYVDDNFKNKYISETIYIINSLLLNRELDITNLKIINEIMNVIKELDSNIIINNKKIKTYHL